MALTLSAKLKIIHFPAKKYLQKDPKTSLNSAKFHFNVSPKLFVKIPQRISSTKPINMVVPLGPGKFYGSSLPRPRIFTDTKFNPERVDPPVPVLDPLLTWADEAHWSMGGLSFKRLRLQGRIEGNVKRLKAQRKKILKNTPEKNQRDSSVSPPPAPVADKRRLLDLNGDYGDEIEVDETVVKREKKKRVLRKGAVRKLGNGFERVAKNSGIGGDVMKIVDDVNSGFEIEIKSMIRTSPRLAKR